MTRPDPSLWKGVVAPEILDALRLASDALTHAQVRHVVVGGLAVSANGHPRATKVVDFLVGREAFVSHASGLMTVRPEVPFQVRGIAVDLLSPEAGEDFLEAVLAQPPGSIMEAPPLVYMKLKASRLKDRADVVELIKASIDVEEVRRFSRRMRRRWSQRSTSWRHKPKPKSSYAVIAPRRGVNRVYLVKDTRRGTAG